MRANLGAATNWASAWKACKAYKGEGGNEGDWRLPTQRELLMIWILYPQLIGKGGFTAYSTNYYWSSSEYSANLAWNMLFINGFASSTSKTSSYYVRCIRDL